MAIPEVKLTRSGRAYRSVDKWMTLGVLLVLPLCLYRRARIVADGYLYPLAWPISFTS